MNKTAESSGRPKQRAVILGRGILRTLLFWFLGLSLLPLIVVVFIINQTTMETLHKNTESKLTSVAKLVQGEVERYFRDNITNLLIEAKRHSIMDMSNEFRLSFQASGLQPAEFVSTPAWALISEKYRRDIEFFIYSRDYFDFLLIDFEGNILYTVKQESDLGTNVFTGKYADTEFGKTCRRAFQETGPHFADYEEYEPSNYEVFSFILTAIHDQRGEKLGLLALQLSSQEIDRIMHVRTGLGATGEIYLIGSDLKMRSNSILETEQTFLKKRIETEASRLWYREHVTRERDPGMKEEKHIYDGPHGEQVLGIHSALEITGIPMGMIAEIETREAFSPAGQIQRFAISLFLATAVFVVFISFYVARKIAHPIQELSAWAGRVAAGDLKQEMISAPRNEIGVLFSAFSNMVEKRKSAEELLKNYSTKLEEMVDERTRELKEAQEELVSKEKLATLGKVSGSISHELRNPLAVIDSSAYYLQTVLRDASEKVLEHLYRIKSSVKKATDIIQSLLDLTRRRDPQLQMLDLVATTREAIAEARVPETVRVIQDCPEEGLLINADRGQICMAFRNIVANAVEAMDSEGILRVVVGITSDDRAEVSISDTGPGIDPDNLDRIFQPLFSAKAKGIGFGLSIAQSVINGHRGTIEAKSAEGKGATIIIRLPLYEDKKGTDNV